MNRVRGAFCLFVAIVGCGAIGGGALTSEPSWVAKADRADRRRQSEIAAIARAVSLYEMRRKELPYDLTKVAESQTDGAIHLALRDSETDAPYDYERLDSRHYKLCANFALESLPRPTPAGEAESAQPKNPWSHQAGVSCFQFDGKVPTPVPIAPTAEATN
jgi:hypothetical protein